MFALNRYLNHRNYQLKAVITRRTKICISATKPVIRSTCMSTLTNPVTINAKLVGTFSVRRILQFVQSGCAKLFKSPIRLVLCSSLGYHKDGIRNVLFHPPLTTTCSEAVRARGGVLAKLVCLLQSLANILQVLFRTFQMCIFVSPLILIAPLAKHSQRFEDLWFDLLLIIIEKCGPVYVKMGQWASTRRDIFPAKVCLHLSKLQRNVQIHSWTFTENLLNHAFGEVKVAGLLTEIDPIPIGSGCVAQVYKGMLDVTQLSKENRKLLQYRIKKNFQDGKRYGVRIPVAIKVLHPRISENFSRDLNVLKSIVSFLSNIFPSLEWLSLKESIDEFASLMEVQVDLSHEAENLLQFCKDFSNDSRIVFPIPILDLCHQSVIVETYESGVPLSNVINKLEEIPNEVRIDIADAGVEMLLKMVFRNNFVHGDLHPGNVMVRGLGSDLRSKESDVQVIVLDPGIVASLAPKDLDNFRAVFSAIARRDGKRVGELFLEQSPNECINATEFISEIDGIVTDALSQQISLNKLDVANLLSRVFSTLRCHRVKLDPNFTSVVLAIMVLEGLGRSLDPDIDLLWKATPYLIKR